MLVMTVIRKDKGITQAGLAEITGIAEPQINAIERGRIVPRGEWQTRIVDALGWKREPSELFDNVRV